MLRQKRDFLFYSTSVYKTNAFVVYINTMALSNKVHVHKQGHYEYRRVQYNLYCIYSTHRTTGNYGPLTKLTFL